MSALTAVWHAPIATLPPARKPRAFRLPTALELLCTRCHKMRPPSDFDPTSTGNTLQSWCRECNRERARHRYYFPSGPRAPKKPEDKAVKIAVTLKPGELRAIDAAAQAKGMNRSAYLIACAVQQSSVDM